MRILRIVSIFIAVLVSAVFLIPQTAANAASKAIIVEKTLVMTQAQINASPRITQSLVKSVSNKTVTFGDGTVTISATITRRDGKQNEAESVWKPVLSRAGYFYFSLVSATIDGKPAARTDLYLIRLAHGTIVRKAIRDYVLSQVKHFIRYTNVVITPGQMSLTIKMTELQ